MMSQTIVKNEDEMFDAIEEAFFKGMPYRTIDNWGLDGDKLRVTFYDKISTQN